MDVELTEEQFAERRKNWTPPAYKANNGVLYKVYKPIPVVFQQILALCFFFSLNLRLDLLSLQYIKNVQSASRGCVTDE